MLVRSLKVVAVLANGESPMLGPVDGTVLPETRAEKRRAAIASLVRVFEEVSWRFPRLTSNQGQRWQVPAHPPTRTTRYTSIWGGGVSNRGGGHLRAPGSEFPPLLSTARSWERHVSPLCPASRPLSHLHPLAGMHGLSQDTLSLSSVRLEQHRGAVGRLVLPILRA